MSINPRRSKLAQTKKPRPFEPGFAFSSLHRRVKPADPVLLEIWVAGPGPAMERVESAAIIHIILHRMRGHAVAVLFFLLQFKVAFDLVLGEDIALGEEVVVGLE
jgi:hypothetical protein